MEVGTTTIGPCYLCRAEEWTRRAGRARDMPELGVVECGACGLVRLDSFDHIDEGFYARFGMHEGEAPDFDAWSRESARDDERRFQFSLPYLRGKRVLDFGCGCGGFLARAKPHAELVAGVDAEASLAGRLESLGVPLYPRSQDAPGPFGLITLFHVLEHLLDPRAVLAELKALLEPGGMILIEVPNASDALLTLYECAAFREFTYWSPHLYLYTASTLSALFAQAGLEPLFVKYIQRYGLANHMHWLAKGAPGGHEAWRFLSSPELDAAYAAQLAALGAADTILAGVGLPGGGDA